MQQRQGPSTGRPGSRIFHFRHTPTDPVWSKETSAFAFLSFDSFAVSGKYIPLAQSRLTLSVCHMQAPVLSALIGLTHYVLKTTLGSRYY